MQVVDPDTAVDALGEAVLALGRAYRYAARRDVDGTHAHLPVRELVALLDDGEHRMAELAELRGVGQSVISRQVAELEARGLACRRPDPGDGRACLVRLTPAGLRLLGDVHAERRRWLREALARAPGQDVGDATRLLRTLARELERHAQAPQQN